MLEKEYKIRRATTDDETLEITIPTLWSRFHRIKSGDKAKVLADGVIVILPPKTSKKEEERARRFIQGRDPNETT